SFDRTRSRCDRGQLGLLIPATFRMDVLLLNLVKWLAGLAIPAALVLFVPRRWRVAAFATWSLLPLPVILVLFIAEIARSPSELAQPDKLVIALIFYIGFIVAPWFVLSLMGGAIGLALRRRRERGAAPVAASLAVPATPPSQAAPIQPAVPIPPI